MGLINIWDRIVGRPTDSSKSDAKQRLQFVLMHDRADIQPEQMNQMKKDIIDVLSKYIEIDKDELEFNLENFDEGVALVANIPIRKAKKTD